MLGRFGSESLPDGDQRPDTGRVPSLAGIRLGHRRGLPCHEPSRPGLVRHGPFRRRGPFRRGLRRPRPRRYLGARADRARERAAVPAPGRPTGGRPGGGAQPGRCPRHRAVGCAVRDGRPPRAAAALPLRRGPEVLRGPAARAEPERVRAARADLARGPGGGRTAADPGPVQRYGAARGGGGHRQPVPGEHPHRGAGHRGAGAPAEPGGARRRPVGAGAAHGWRGPAHRRPGGRHGQPQRRGAGPARRHRRPRRDARHRGRRAAAARGRPGPAGAARCPDTRPAGPVARPAGQRREHRTACQQLRDRRTLAAGGPGGAGGAQPAPRPGGRAVPPTGGGACLGPAQRPHVHVAHPARTRRASAADAGEGRQLPPLHLRAADRRLPAHR